ncbi:MAG: hypothetical protein HC789_03335 [Microcoleus sp. CSU_2_2]|nr:hypothetical protein [Microcoleus sp. SU_5_3]NJS09466.1 hypothetical protein [Microcoleus sp. CSU_2_2]
MKHSDLKPVIDRRDDRPNASPLQVYKTDATGHDMISNPVASELQHI